MEKYWNAIPSWFKAILLTFVLLIPASTLIQYMIFRNVASLPELPWSVIITCVLLGLYWQFIRGAEYPFGKSKFRARYSATSTEKKIVFSSYWKIGASLLMFIFSVNAIGFALFGMEDSVQLEVIRRLGTAPIHTAIPLYFGLALAAGIIEETAFRGYMQSIMIEKYGIVFSFVSVALVFTLIHFLPPALYIPYFMVSLAFSWVAYTTGSIIVGIGVHALFNFVAFLLVYFDTIYVSPAHLDSSISINILIAIVTALLLWYEGSKLISNNKIGSTT